MIVGYMLAELSNAVKEENYTRQSQIADYLLSFEECGKVTNQDVIEAIALGGE